MIGIVLVAALAAVAEGGNHAHLLGDQIGCQRRQLIELAMRPAIFDLDVLAFDKSCLAEAAPECGGQGGKGLGRGETKIADDRQRLLLRADGERPRGRRAANERDELASPHSITSSARDAKAGDIDKPIAFAALRFITIWYFVGAWIGRSLGFSPLRIRLA